MLVGVITTGLTLASCGPAGYYTETPDEVPRGQAAVAEVTCAPLGNRGGFNIEFPPCVCNHGITLSWVGQDPARRDGWTGYVLRRGYLSDVVPEVLIASRDGQRIERVLVRDESTYAWTELEPDKNGNEWRRNQALFSGIMQELGPRLGEFDSYCQEKEIGRAERPRPVRQAALTGDEPQP